MGMFPAMAILSPNVLDVQTNVPPDIQLELTGEMTSHFSNISPVKEALAPG